MGWIATLGCPVVVWLVMGAGVRSGGARGVVICVLWGRRLMWVRVAALFRIGVGAWEWEASRGPERLAGGSVGQGNPPRPATRGAFCVLEPAGFFCCCRGRLIFTFLRLFQFYLTRREVLNENFRLFLLGGSAGRFFSGGAGRVFDFRRLSNPGWGRGASGAGWRYVEAEGVSLPGRAAGSWALRTVGAEVVEHLPTRTVVVQVHRGARIQGRSKTSWGV